jgi:cell division protein FtsB
MTEPIEIAAENPSSAPVTRKPRRQLSSTQVLFAVILTIALMLAIQFSSRIQDERELTAIRDTIEDEIELLRREQTDLIDQLAYVESDAYVESWAHSEGRMVRNGEVLVIPVPSTLTLQQNTQTTVANANAEVHTTLPEPETWEVWWALFFDTSPPQLGS